MESSTDNPHFYANLRNEKLIHAFRKAIPTSKYVRLATPTSSGKTFLAAYMYSKIAGLKGADGSKLKYLIFISPQINQLRSYKEECNNTGINDDEILYLKSLADTFLDMKHTSDIKRLCDYVLKKDRAKAEALIDDILDKVTDIKKYDQLSKDKSNNLSQEIGNNLIDAKKFGNGSLTTDISLLKSLIKNYLLATYHTTDPEDLYNDQILNKYFPGRQLSHDNQFKIILMTTSKALENINPFSTWKIFNPNLGHQSNNILKNSLIVWDEADAQCEYVLKHIAEKAASASTDLIGLVQALINTLLLDRVYNVNNLSNPYSFSTRFTTGGNNEKISKLFEQIHDLADKLYHMMSINNTFAPDFQFIPEDNASNNPPALLYYRSQAILSVKSSYRLYMKAVDDENGKRFEIFTSHQKGSTSFGHFLRLCKQLISYVAQLCRYFAYNECKNDGLDLKSALRSALDELNISDSKQQDYLINEVYKIPAPVANNINPDEYTLIDMRDSPNHNASTHFNLMSVTVSPEQLFANAIASAGYSLIMSATVGIPSLNNYDFDKINEILNDSDLLTELKQNNPENNIEAEYLFSPEEVEEIRKTIEAEAAQKFAKTEFIVKRLAIQKLAADAKEKLRTITGLDGPELAAMASLDDQDSDGSDYRLSRLLFAAQVINEFYKYGTRVGMIFQGSNLSQGEKNKYNLKNLEKIANGIAMKNGKHRKIKVQSLTASNFDQITNDLGKVEPDTLYVLVSSYSSISTGYNITYKFNNTVYDLDAIALGQPTNLIPDIKRSDATIDQNINRLEAIYKELKNSQMLLRDYPDEQIQRIINDQTNYILKNTLNNVNQKRRKDIKHSLIEITPYQKAAWSAIAQAVGRMGRGNAKNKKQLILFSDQICFNGLTSETICQAVFGQTIISYPLQQLLNNLDQKGGGSRVPANFQKAFLKLNSQANQRKIRLLDNMRVAKEGGKTVSPKTASDYRNIRNSIASCGFKIENDPKAEKLRNRFFLTTIDNTPLNPFEDSYDYYQETEGNDQKRSTKIYFEQNDHSSLLNFESRFGLVSKTAQVVKSACLFEGNLPLVLSTILKHPELESSGFPYTPTTSAYDILAGEIGEGLLQIILQSHQSKSWILQNSLPLTQFEDFDFYLKSPENSEGGDIYIDSKYWRNSHFFDDEKLSKLLPKTSRAYHHNHRKNTFIIINTRNVDTSKFIGNRIPEPRAIRLIGNDSTNYGTLYIVNGLYTTEEITNGNPLPISNRIQSFFKFLDKPGMETLNKILR